MLKRRDTIVMVAVWFFQDPRFRIFFFVFFFQKKNLIKKSRLLIILDSEETEKEKDN